MKPLQIAYIDKNGILSYKVRKKKGMCFSIENNRIKGKEDVIARFLNIKAVVNGFSDKCEIKSGLNNDDFAMDRTSFMVFEYYYDEQPLKF